jgi:hypothetical protein
MKKIMMVFVVAFGFLGCSVSVDDVFEFEEYDLESEKKGIWVAKYSEISTGMTMEGEVWQEREDWKEEVGEKFFILTKNGEVVRKSINCVENEGSCQVPRPIYKKGKGFRELVFNKKEEYRILYGIGKVELVPREVFEFVLRKKENNEVVLVKPGVIMGVNVVMDQMVYDAVDSLKEGELKGFLGGDGVAEGVNSFEGGMFFAIGIVGVLMIVFLLLFLGTGNKRD